MLFLIAVPIHITGIGQHGHSDSIVLEDQHILLFLWIPVGPRVGDASTVQLRQF